MKKVKFQNLKKAVISIIAFFLGVIITGHVIINENAAQVNGALGIDTIVIEDPLISAEDKANGIVNPDYEYFPSKYQTLAELIPDSRAKVEEVMAEGVVLLKNAEGALPLNIGSKVGLLSLNSLNPVYGGTGSGAVKTETAPTFMEAFQKDGNMTVNTVLWDYYASVNNDESGYKRTTGPVYNSAGEAYMGVNGINHNGDVPWQTVIAAEGVEASLAEYGDAAIVVLSRVGGEGSDLVQDVFNLQDPSDSTDHDYLQITPVEKSILEGLKEKKDAGQIKKIVVLVNSANVLQMDFVDNEAFGIDAALWIGTPGQVGLNAVSDILVGKINPSGHLSDTMWYDHDANPVNANFGSFGFENYPEELITKFGSSSSHYVVYQEGIYLGYRYTETRYEDFVTGRAKTGNYNYSSVVKYPFGYGLSYTTFTFSDVNVSTQGNDYIISVNVTNTGDTAGKQVAQIYLQKPYIENGVEKAAVELVGYAKTELLAPGASQVVTVTVNEKWFTSYDSENYQTYVMDSGDYYFTVGTDAHNAINNILAAKGYTPENTDSRMDAQGNANLTVKISKANLTEEQMLAYSTSEATGVKITNLFDSVDINRYEGRGDNHVTYMTRSNWEGTSFFSKDDCVKLTWTDQMTQDALYMSSQGMSDTIEQDDIVYPTMDADNGLTLIQMRGLDYDDPQWEKLLDQLSWEDMATMAATGVRRTGEIIDIAKPTTVDHNGPSGLTNRYSVGPLGLATRTNDPDKDQYAMCYPAAGIIAATFNDGLIYEMGDMIGEEALWAGYAGLYGPGSNIHRSPYSGRNYEYYSEDSFLSGMICANAVAGMQSHGMYVYNKHCLLNDQEYDRMGICTWANEQTIRELYGRAFELPITEGDAKGVMTGYNRIGLIWCGASKALVTDFLRGECGMDGFASTDMWYFQTAYMNLPRMLLAGTSIVDGFRSSEDLAFAAEGGYGEVAWALREATHHTLYAVANSNAMNGMSNQVRVLSITPWWVTLLTTLEIVLFAALIASIAWVVIDLKKMKKQEA